MWSNFVPHGFFAPQTLSAASAIIIMFAVDVFGKCGPNKCPGTNSGVVSGECGRLLEREYMFYLAFENSKCDDYVTEKFFATAKMDIVPIVMGGSNYSVR